VRASALGPAEVVVPASAPTPGEVRRANFPPVMDFYAPGLKRWQSSEWVPGNPRRFLPVSVTGSACALSCDHCQAKVLEGMISVKAAGPGEDLFALARRLHGQGSEGLLVSGGSTRSGGVPLLPHLRHIPRIREELGMKVIVHSGVVSPRLAAGLAEAGVDGVMLDIIGADETLREVYHLDLTVADMDRSLRLLADRGLRVIPHIVLGLHYGRFLGEHRALEMVAGYPVSTLILVVLVPLVGTPMAHIPPPPVDEVTGFFATARLAAPTTTINLGCARPLGPVKAELDRAAVDLGLNGIAYPADGAIEYARSRGMEPRLYEYCCSLTWTGAQETGYATVKVSA
jgi:lipoyl synthase